MPTKTKEVATKTEAEVLPAYLKDKEVKGIEEMRQYKSTPLIKLIQTSSKPDAKDMFGEGSIVASDTKLAGKEEPLTCIPVYFWPSWQKRSDNDDSNSFFIVEESFDKNSEIATKSRNPALRVEDYPDNPNFAYNYTQSLNFAIYMTNGPLAGAVAVVKFSMGGHKIGEALLTYLERTGTSIFHNQIELTSLKTTNAKGQSWYQLAYSPCESPWAPSELVDQLEETHDLMAQEHKRTDSDMGKETPSDD